MRIGIFHTGFRECFIGPVTKTCHIPCEHVVLRFTVDHPLCRQQTQPTGLRETRNNAANKEIVFQLRHRPPKRVCIRRPDHGAIDHPLDPCCGGHRNAFCCTDHVFHDAIQIIREQIMGKIQRGAVLCPELHVFFIGADQQPVAFLPEIIFTIPVGD